MNNLNGTIPDCLNQLSKLTWLAIGALEVGYSQLSGTIPASLFTMQSLDTLS